MQSSHEARLARALDSLEGLSVGDAFGECFFVSLEMIMDLMESDEFDGPPFDFQDSFIRQVFVDIRRIPPKPTPWKWTDDTALALEIYKNLADFEKISPQALARQFAARYRKEPGRGYGGAMHSLLPELTFKDWREAAPALFNGTGSYGNGGAMRVAPVGAYFADDLEAVVENAAFSAKVTHSHPEGVAGAVAVALAAAFAARARETGEFPTPTAYLNSILTFMPESVVRERTEIVRDMGEDVIGETVAEMVGSGENIAAEDTVPFCLWCAAQHLQHYDEAIWLTLTGLGDRDTTCAIVGGIVGAATGVAGIPEEWRANREPLDL